MTYPFLSYRAYWVSNLTNIWYDMKWYTRMSLIGILITMYKTKKMLKIIKKRYILIHMNSFLWNFSDIGCYLWNLPSIRAQNGYSISVLICQSNWCQQGIRHGMHSSFTQFKLVPVLTYGTLLNPNVTHQSTKRMWCVICLPNT